MTDLIASGAESSEFNVLAVPIGELIIGTVAFLIVFFVLGKLLLPKISKALEEREQAIEGGLKKAEEAEAESARLAAQNQDELAKAREEAAGIRAAAQAERADIIEKARSEAQAAAAGSDLQRNVGAIATDLAGRIVGEVLTDNATAQGVVDRFISELEAASGSNGKA